MAPFGGFFDKLHSREGSVDNLGAALPHQGILDERAAVFGEQSQGVVEAGRTRWRPVEEGEQLGVDLLVQVHRSRNPQRFQNQQLLLNEGINLGGQFLQVRLGRLQCLTLLQDTLPLLGQYLPDELGPPAG